MSETFEPVTRKELLLKCAIEGTIPNFEPYTREEALLYALCTKNAGGGANKTVILPEQTIEGFAAQFDMIASNYLCNLYGQLAPLVVGEEYTIVFDGEEFSCVPVEMDNGVIATGNLFLADESLDDTGEPVFIGYFSEELVGNPGGGTSILTTKEGESHTIAIYQEGGSDVGLPKVTEKDNGKHLEVVDGAWAVV